MVKTRQSLTLLFVICCTGIAFAENGSITITRLDGEYVNVLDNQLGDMIEFCINEDGHRSIIIGWNDNQNHAVVNALQLLNYSVLNNTTDLGIVKLIEMEYTRRQNELVEIKRREEQVARDLANRTHVNTYEWVKSGWYTDDSCDRNNQR
jgi:maltodextrin utilization protein YvdJ